MCISWSHIRGKPFTKTMKVLYGAAGAAVNKIDTLRKEKQNKSLTIDYKNKYEFD